MTVLAVWVGTALLVVATVAVTDAAAAGPSTAGS
jgi:hypothetical protein